MAAVYRAVAGSIRNPLQPRHDNAVNDAAEVHGGAVQAYDKARVVESEQETELGR
jgi:hypothetical protein